MPKNKNKAKTKKQLHKQPVNENAAPETAHGSAAQTQNPEAVTNLKESKKEMASAPQASEQQSKPQPA